MKDGFESNATPWILFPEVQPYKGFSRILIMLETEVYIKDIGAIESLNQKQI
jgi:hypothetical protein